MAELDLVTVSRLNTYVNRVVRSLEPLKNVHVIGELSNFKRYSSGHCYFSLKDSGAQVSCVMFGSFANRMDFEPKNGQSVVVVASADYYTKTGNFQLQVTSMYLEGMGQLYQQYEALKEKLAGEGLFGEELKRPLPYMPKKIGVITSPSGAVIRDIIHVLRRRNPHFELLLIPAAVQGDQAAPSLVRALELMNRREDIDVIIIGRGGGSLEDLWPFNEEAVARAVAGSRIPIVSAVGHETDFTICDFVADYRAPTPSAAAEVVMPEYDGLARLIETEEQRLAALLKRKLDMAELRLTSLTENRQLRDPQELVRMRRERLVRLAESRSITNPLYIVESRTQYLDLLESKLARTSASLLATLENRLSRAASKLDALSPLKVLGRGYALVLDDRGQAVQSVSQTQEDEVLDLHLQDGRLAVRVETVEAVKREGVSYDGDE